MDSFKDSWVVMWVVWIGVQCWLLFSAVPVSQTQSVEKWDSTCLRRNQSSSDGTNDGTGKLKIQKVSLYQ